MAGSGIVYVCTTDKLFYSYTPSSLTSLTGTWTNIDMGTSNCIDVSASHSSNYIILLTDPFNTYGWYLRKYKLDSETIEANVGRCVIISSVNSEKALCINNNHALYLYINGSWQTFPPNPIVSRVFNYNLSMTSIDSTLILLTFDGIIYLKDSTSCATPCIISNFFDATIVAWSFYGSLPWMIGNGGSIYRSSLPILTTAINLQIFV